MPLLLRLVEVDVPGKPVVAPVRSVSLGIAGIGLVVTAAWSVERLIRSSARPGNYYQYRHSADGFVYPTHEVVWWCVAIVVELVIALSFLVFAPRSSPPAARLAILGALFGLGLLGCGLLAMHAPPYYGGHLVWLFRAAAWTFVMAFPAALEHWHKKRVETRPTQP